MGFAGGGKREKKRVLVLGCMLCHLADQASGKCVIEGICEKVEDEGCQCGCARVYLTVSRGCVKRVYYEGVLTGCVMSPKLFNRNAASR